MPIPDRFPATGTDIGVAITRAVTLHRIGLRLVFESRLDADRLARATRLALDAEPTLGCRFVTNTAHPYWERLPDLDDRLLLTTIEAEDAEAAITAFQTEEVPDEGPQLAALLVRTPAGDELGIKVSHVLADGQAAKQCAYLLADVYTRLGSDPAYVPEPNLRPRPTESDVWERLTPEQRKAAKKAAAYTMPNWPVPSDRDSGRGLTYRTLALTPERFRALKAYGRARDATVNDVMLAAFFRACVAAFDPPIGVSLSLMSTADHRRFLADPDSLPISNISISGSLGIERVVGESFDDTLRRVRASMAAWAKTSYGAAPARNAERLARLPYRVVQRLMGAVFTMGKAGTTYPWYTNVGIIDADRLAFTEATPKAAYLFGPATSGPSIVPVISTYRDALTVCMGYCAEDFDITPVMELLGEELATPTAT